MRAQASLFHEAFVHVPESLVLVPETFVLVPEAFSSVLSPMVPVEILAVKGHPAEKVAFDARLGLATLVTLSVLVSSA